MRTRLFFIVVLMGVFFGVTSLALAQEGSTVIVTTQPDQPTGSFALQMPTADISATYSLYLIATTAQDNVSLSGYLQDANRQVLANTAVEFLSASGQPLTAINLPAGQTRIGMRISNLTQHGSFTGTIGLQSPTVPIGFSPIATFTLAHPPQAQISIKPADAQNVIALQSASPAFHYPLTVLEIGGQSEAEVRLTLGPVTRKDAVVGQPAELHFDATNAPTTTLTVSPGNYAVASIIGNLPEQTAYTTWLMAQQGNQTVIYTLNISRSAAGGIAALDAANGTISVPVSAANFDRVLMFQVASDQPAINDLTIALTDPPLRTDGQPVVSETLLCNVCTGTPLPALQPGQIFTVALSGRNFQATTYSAPLRLSYQGQTQNMPLAITRFQSKQTFTLTAPISATGTSFGVGGYAEVSTQVADSSGVDTRLYYPVSEGAQLLQTDSNGRPVAWTPAPTATFVLPANGSTVFTLRWTGLQAGAYPRTIYMAGPNSAPVVQNVTLNVKDTVVLAFLAILLGVVASYWIQSRTASGRARDMRSAEIARLRQQVLAQPSDDMWSDLLARVDDLEWNNRLSTELDNTSLTATLNDLRQRAENYRQALAANTRVIDLLAVFPEQDSNLKQTKHDFEKQRERLLQGVKAALQLPEKQGLGDTATDAPAQVKALGTLFDEIRKASIRKPTEGLLSQLEKLKSDYPELTVGVERWKTEANNILTALNADEFDGLTDRLEKARQGYAALQLQAVEQALDRLVADRAAAPNATPDDWKPVDDLTAATRTAIQQARQLTTADEQIHDSEIACHDYLAALIAQLAVLISSPGRPGGCTVEVWQQAVNATSVANQQQQAQQAVQGDQWELAQSFYTLAQTEYAKAQVELLKKKVADFKALFDQAPQGIDTGWETALTSLKPLLDKVQQLAITPEQVLQNRLDFAKGQVDVWNAVHAWATGHFTTGLPQPWQTLHTTVVEADTARQAYEARQKKEDVQQLITVESKLAEAHTQYQDIRGTQRLLDAAAVAMGREEVISAVEEVLGALGGAVRDMIVAAGELMAVPAQGLLTRLESPQPLAARSPEDWYRQVRRNDQLQALLVWIVAAITGVTTLWVNNPTFGGTDYLVAILWGFGLNEAAQGLLKMVKDSVVPLK